VLTPSQRLFVSEYLIDLNATKAAIRAGYSAKSAGSMGHTLLQNPEIKALVEREVEERKVRSNITADLILEEWRTLANADPRELVEFRRLGCRCCHGIDHQYQWRSEQEFRAAHSTWLLLTIDPKAKRKAGPEPSDAGGYGYVKNCEPVETCTACGGDGVEDIRIADTRHLSRSARALYAGVQVTKDGVKVLMRDQDKARELIARHIGMLKEKVEHSGSIEGPAVAVINMMLAKKPAEEPPHRPIISPENMMRDTGKADGWKP